MDRFSSNTSLAYEHLFCYKGIIINQKCKIFPKTTKNVPNCNLTVTRSYTACRENEKCQDQLLDCKLGRGKVLSEKEHLKLQAKRKKSESAVRKCDMEYYAAAIKSERSR